MSEVKAEQAALVEAFIASLAQELPPVFARKDIPRFFGGSLAVGTLANLGPKLGPPYIRRGRHAIYEKSQFLSWYRSWLLRSSEPHTSSPR